METIVQYGLSTLVENATVVKTTRNANTLQNFAPNVLTVKNTYKTGYRIGLVFIQLQDGKSIYSLSFFCNIAALSCTVAALGCRVFGKYRPIPGLSVAADGLTICADTISNGGTRLTVMEMLL
jgi:hypothetical protein